MSEYNSMDTGSFSGFWVLCECGKDSLTEVSLELLGEGRRIAAERGAELCALILGSNVSGLASMAADYGADKVFVCESAYLDRYRVETYTKVICDLVRQYRPEVLLLPASEAGRELAPRCAARLKTGLCADCTSLSIDNSCFLEFTGRISGTPVVLDNPQSVEACLKMSMPAFGGKLMETIICPRFRPQMATVRPGVMKKEAVPSDISAKCKIIRPSVELAEKDIWTEIIGEAKKNAAAGDIASARVIVAVGHGIGADPDKGLELAGRLANVLGGELAGSRDAVISGWIPEESLVGQTGKTVRPDLYIALGISGAMQHLTGMQDSKMIIAVNRDKNAPIFDYADYGLVGDLFEIVPLLTEGFSKINIKTHDERKHDNG